jgi:hypothetical protein
MKLRDNAKELMLDNNRVVQSLKDEWNLEQTREKEKLANGSPVQMLPSPASITSSANSTPAGKEEAEEPKPSRVSAQGQPSAKQQNVRSNPNDIPGHITIVMNYYMMNPRRSQSESLYNAMKCFECSRDVFTLPMLNKHFPRTYQRVVGTTLSPTDEHEPDIEDEEGELYWPGQFLSDGIGWLCLVGKAMVKEFGKEYGDRGIDGAIHKEEGDHTIVSHCPDPISQPMSVQR